MLVVTFFVFTFELFVRLCLDIFLFAPTFLYLVISFLCLSLSLFPLISAPDIQPLGSAELENMYIRIPLRSGWAEMAYVGFQQWQ